MGSETTIVRGACPHDCPDTCAMLTTVVDGRAVRVRGDPAHPFTRGALCAKVRDYERRVYHPQRILYPLKRAGRKGEVRFERVTWEQALAAIAGAFTGIIAEHGPQAILPCSYLGQQGLLNGLHVGDPFFNRLGASIGERTFCGAGATLAYNMTLGATPGLDPESFAHARYIVLWACNAASNMAHHWPFILQARRAGAKLVVIDPLRSKTAARADWHIAIRPGTDVALALGITHVLIDEGLVDRDYVDRHTHGFEELRARAREYPPARVAEITGIAARALVRLAREYAGTHPSAIRVGVAIERSNSGPQAVRAVCALPALIGAWRYPGGGVFQNAARAFPIQREALAHPELIRPGTRVVNLLSLGAALTGRLGLAPPIQALFVYNCNPVTASPEQERIVQGLAREDLFTVVSEQFMTDTARYADYVLPAATQLEQFDLMYSWGHFHVALNRPAIEPRGEAVSNTELFRRLAARMGFEEPCLRRSDEAIAREALDWAHPALAGITLEGLYESGYARLNLGEPALRAPHAEGGFPSATGKVELYSTEAEKGSTVLAPFRQCHALDQELLPLDPLPGYAVPAEQAPGYPLVLLSPKSHQFVNSCYANFTLQGRRAGEQWVLLHPEDARPRGIEAGARVRVFNQFGAIEVRARISTDTLPGVAVVPHGYWRSREGASVNALQGDRPTRLGKAPGFSDTRVEVRVSGASP